MQVRIIRGVILMNTETQKKYYALIKEIETYCQVAIAFSGGVDSTLLAKVAHDTLGKNAMAITVDSEAYPPSSIVSCRSLAEMIGIRLVEIKTSVFAVPGFVENSPERCYHCKKALFPLMLDKAKEQGITVLVDGSNSDDNADYRPGIRALKELNVKSPLKNNGFTKEDIRAVSKELGLTTWNMQSCACLASRMPYGTRISPELLEKTWRAEELLKTLGIVRFRVRHHGDTARLELDFDGMEIVLEHGTRQRVIDHLKALGYTYVTLDMEGYRSGSMNEILPAKVKNNP